MNTVEQNSDADLDNDKSPETSLVPPPRERDRLVAALALGGVVGPLFFVITFTVLGFLRAGYSHLSDPISLLAEPGAWTAPFQTANFLLLGLLTVAFAVALHRGVGGGRGSRLGPALLALAGIVGLIGSALFPCDPGCEAVTVTGRLHETLSGVGFLGFILALFTLSSRLRHEPRWRPFAAYTLVTGVVAVLLLVAFGVTISGAVQALQPWAGLLQRLFILSILQWMVFMALRLRRLAEAGSPSDWRRP